MMEDIEGVFGTSTPVELHLHDRRQHYLLAPHFVEVESSEGEAPLFSLLAQTLKQNESKEKYSLWHPCLSSNTN